MRCLVVDDNTKTSRSLVKLLQGSGMVKSVEEAVHPYMIKGMIDKGEVDLLFIRVRLWDYRMFEDCARVPHMVFLCGGRNKLTTKLETSVRFSLREPIRGWDVQRLIKTVATYPESEPTDFLFVRYSNRHHKIGFDNIEMVERLKGNFVMIWSKTGDWMVPGTLREYQRQLPPDRFIRIADGVLLPATEVSTITDATYTHRGRQLKLTFRFTARARKELSEYEVDAQ
jgi:two-component system LytT family response regulator